MAEQTELDELRLAWSALSGQAAGDGWMTIPVRTETPRFRAGIRYPEGHQALLVGFNEITTPKKAELPEGLGFSTGLIPEAAGNGFTHWIGLTSKGNIYADLFTQMAADIMRSLLEQRDRGETWLLTLLLARVRAWQEFMRRPRNGVLSPEAEQGLAGELLVLEDMMSCGVSAVTAVEAWQGPSGALQDFLFATYGLEVKTTLASKGFPARITSLEQLDNAQGRAVLLAATRLCLHQDGRALPALISDLRTALAGFPATLAAFDLQLLLAGYFDAVAAEYTRQFLVVETRVFPVDGDFPRLVRSEIRPEILAAEYNIDIDRVSTPATSIAALTEMGVF